MRAVVGNTGLEIVVKGIVLIHPPNRPASGITLMVKALSMPANDIVEQILRSEE